MCDVHKCSQYIRNFIYEVNSIQARIVFVLNAAAEFVTVTVRVLEFSILRSKTINEVSGKMMGDFLGMRQTFNEALIVSNRNSTSKYSSFSPTFFIRQFRSMHVFVYA